MARSRKRRGARPPAGRLQQHHPRGAPDDEDLLMLAHLAESRMEFANALALLRQVESGGRVLEGWRSWLAAGWIVELEDLVEVADDPEPWRLAEWLGRAALRWALLWPDERVPPLAWAFAGARWGARATTDKALQAIHSYPWILEAALFDLGLFDDFLDRVAPALAVDGAGLVRDWCAQPVRLLRCVSVQADEVGYQDEHGPGRFDCRAVGDPSGVAVGDRLLTRLLPVPGEPSYLSLLPGILIDADPPGRGELPSPETRLRWFGRWLASDEAGAA